MIRIRSLGYSVIVPLCVVRGSVVIAGVIVLCRSLKADWDSLLALCVSGISAGGGSFVIERLYDDRTQLTLFCLHKLQPVSFFFWCFFFLILAKPTGFFGSQMELSTVWYGVTFSVAEKTELVLWGRGLSPAIVFSSFLFQLQSPCKTSSPASFSE